MAHIELKNVSKSYGEGEDKIEVLRNINLKIEEGEFVAINTIHATETVIRNPVKINGNADGNIILNTFCPTLRFNTLATLIKSLSTEETPNVVLIKVAHIAHKPTAINEIIKDTSPS